MVANKLICVLAGVEIATHATPQMATDKEAIG